MKYNLKDILIFTYVAKFKSFARASETLNISRAVVSTRISELEKLLGISLLARTTREVNLTSDGKVFFDYCNSVLEKVENLDEFLYKHKGAVGTLSLVFPFAFSKYYVLPHLNEFLKKYPNLKLNISVAEAPVNVITQGYDLQVRRQFIKEEGLEAISLIKDRKLICAAPEYLKKFGNPQNPKDLLTDNCLIFSDENIWKFKHKVTREIIQLNELGGNIVCDSSEVIKKMLLNGTGIALKSATDVAEEIIKGNLQILFDDYEILNEECFYAVYPAGKYPSSKTKAFIDFIKGKLTDNDIFADAASYTAVRVGDDIVKQQSVVNDADIANPSNTSIIPGK